MKDQMKAKFVVISMVVTAVVLLSILALYVRVGSTADSVAILRTTGMTCGSCSSTIIDTLQNVKGVAVAEVDVAGGWVVVGYDTKSVKPETLAEKVSASGFGTAVHRILTTEQFKQIFGRDIGKKAASTSGCCGSKGGGCGSGKQEKQS
jgi:copper chaperone CopZ